MSTEGKTLSKMLGAAADIEDTKMTPHQVMIMNSPSPDDKYFIELPNGSIVTLSSDEPTTAAALKLLKRQGESSIRKLGEEEVPNIVPYEASFNEGIWLTSWVARNLRVAYELPFNEKMWVISKKTPNPRVADVEIKFYPEDYGGVRIGDFDVIKFYRTNHQLPTTSGVGRSVLDIQDTDDDGQLGNSRDKRNEEDIVNYDKRLQGVYSIIAKMFRFCRATLLSPFKANRETANNPASSNDFNAPQGAVRKTFKAFLWSSLDIPLHQRVIMVMLFGGILKQLVENFLISGLFEITTNTSVVNINDTNYDFIPKIVHMAAIMMCYMAIWVLVLPLESGVLMFLVPLLIFAPLFLVISLFSKASATGGFNFAVFGFIALGSFGFCLVSVSVIFLVFYFIWRHTGQRTPASGQESDDQVLSNLMEVMSNV